MDSQRQRGIQDHKELFWKILYSTFQNYQFSKYSELSSNRQTFQENLPFLSLIKNKHGIHSLRAGATSSDN
jgi:hypothetical protein